jgi:hypothetical protein
MAQAAPGADNNHGIAGSDVGILDSLRTSIDQRGCPVIRLFGYCTL